jgi:hypothetical protein
MEKTAKMVFQDHQEQMGEMGRMAYLVNRDLKGTTGGMVCLDLQARQGRTGKTAMTEEMVATVLLGQLGQRVGTETTGPKEIRALKALKVHPDRMDLKEIRDLKEFPGPPALLERKEIKGLRDFLVLLVLREQTERTDEMEWMADLARRARPDL